MRQLLALLGLMGLGGGIACAEPAPLPRPRPAPPPAWAEPHSFREAAGPDFNSAAVTAKLTDCDERLAKVAAIEPMPRLVGPDACGGGDIVRLDSVSFAGQAPIELRPAPYLRCAMAESLTAWLHDEAAPRAAALGAALRSVETYDDFECRGRNRVNGAKMSEHGKGNAIDVRAFTLANGRLVTLTDMTVAKDVREDLRKSACARFTTVLGPGSDGQHEAHIHLDLAERHNGYRICQWDVREPPKPAEVASAAANHVPLPIPRPAIADGPVPRARKL